MSYSNSTAKLLCFCTGLMVTNIFGMQEEQLITEGVNKMDELQLSKWLEFAKNLTVSKKFSRFTAKDRFGTPVVIELRIVNKEDPDLEDILERFSDIAAESMAPGEVDFLRANPRLPFENERYQEFKSLFIKGINAVDWGSVQETMRTRIKNFFGKDRSTFSSSNLYIFGEIKNKETQSLQGVISFGISPAIMDGDIKLTNIAIVPELQDHGLGKLLISSIFKIISQIKRIILKVRPTNQQAIDVYSALGFIKDLTPICDATHEIKKEEFTSLQYRTKMCYVLQVIAELLIE